MFRRKTGRLAVVLVYLFAAIAVAGATALSALLSGVTFTDALLLYAVSGMLTLLSLPLLMKGVELACGWYGALRSDSNAQEMRLIEYHGKKP